MDGSLPDPRIQAVAITGICTTRLPSRQHAGVPRLGMREKVAPLDVVSKGFDDDIRVQLQHVRWRKQINEAKIRTALQVSREAAKRELIDQLTVDRGADAARWRLAVIQDEIEKPLALDVSKLQRFDEQSKRTSRQEANEFQRHMKALTWIEKRVKLREPRTSPLSPTPMHTTEASTFTLMKTRLEQLTEKVKYRASKKRN